MILYINGDSHTAAAEAVTPHAFAEDESELFYLVFDRLRNQSTNVN